MVAGAGMAGLVAAAEARRLGAAPAVLEKLERPGGPLDDLARRHDAAPGQLALAWLLARSPVMLPIPGTASVEHLEENMAAQSIELAREEVERLEAAA